MGIAFAACYWVFLLLALGGPRRVRIVLQYTEQARGRARKVAKLLTYTYGPQWSSLFGGDDGKYHGTCAICLMDWADNDVISITPCAHAFHQECIQQWLRKKQTCAACRQDLTIARTEREAG